MLTVGVLPFAFAANEGGIMAEKKATYDLSGWAGDHNKWIPKKGCNMLIQAPAGSKAASACRNQT